MLKVSECMSGAIIDIDGNASVLEAIALMREKRIGALLVRQQGVIAGIFTERDLLNKVDYTNAKELPSIKVSDLMTGNLKTVHADEPYIEVMELMQRHAIRHMPIVRDGQVIGIISLRDLLHRYAETLRESEEKIRTILENIHDTIFQFSPEGIIQYVNPEVEGFYGYKPEDLLGKHIDKTTPKNDLPKALYVLNLVLSGEKIKNLEMNQIDSKGIIFLTEVNFTPISKDGKIVAVEGIFRDVTERKKLERLREEFVWVVSHELRTPLVPIKEGVSQVLDGVHGTTTSQQKEYLTVVLAEIDRLKSIIDDLLDVFKFETGKTQIHKELVDIVALAKRVVLTFSLRAQKKGLALKTKFSAESIKVFCDRDNIIQVFSNLVSNAIKFTDSGYIEISVEDRGTHIECSVSDTGRGVTVEICRIYLKVLSIERLV